MLEFAPKTRAVVFALSTIALLISAPSWAGLPRLVKDVNPGSGDGFDAGHLSIGSTTFFEGHDAATGFELWKTDGTPSGTVLVKDINPGAGSSFPSRFCSTGGLLYFAATEPTGGRELWRSDGTTAGTVRVKDIQAGPSGSAPIDLVCAAGMVFFAADDGVSGLEPWRSDGTAAGTILLKDILPGAGFYQSTGAVGGRWVFMAQDSSAGLELWVSDGTTGGTVLLKDINPGPASSSAVDFITVDGTIYLNLNDGSTGFELWKTDGTTAGTVMVRDINNPGPASSNPHAFASAGGVLYFAANDGTNGYELWRSDGTMAGTTMVEDIAAGSASSVAFEQAPTAVGSTVFFLANDQVHGVELWKSDGTAAGTMLVRDIVPADGLNDFRSGAAVGDLLYIPMDDGTGMSLWRSDGSEAGTFAVIGLPDVEVLGDPFTDADGLLYFPGYSASAGEELWALNGCSAPLNYDTSECADSDVCTHSVCGADLICQTTHAPLPAGLCEVPAVAGKSSFQLKDSATDASDKLLWKWQPGNTNYFFGADLEFGADPVTLCAYDANGIVARAALPSGQLCGGVSCWAVGGTTLKFKDKAGTFDGMQSTLIQDKGPTAGKIIAKGKGANLNFVPPPWSGSVTVEMTSTDDGSCVQATYGAPTKNQAGQYKAKGG